MTQLVISGHCNGGAEPEHHCNRTLYYLISSMSAKLQGFSANECDNSLRLQFRAAEAAETQGPAMRRMPQEEDTLRDQEWRGELRALPAPAVALYFPA